MYDISWLYEYLLIPLDNLFFLRRSWPMTFATTQWHFYKMRHSVIDIPWYIKDSMDTIAYDDQCYMVCHSVIDDICHCLSIYLSIHPSIYRYISKVIYIYIYIYICTCCMHANLHTYITLHYITLHYSTLQYITLHYITSHHITSHHITSHHITWHDITLHYITLPTYLHSMVILLLYLNDRLRMVILPGRRVPRSYGSAPNTWEIPSRCRAALVFFSPIWLLYGYYMVNNEKIWLMNEKIEGFHKWSMNG